MVLDKLTYGPGGPRTARTCDQDFIQAASRTPEKVAEAWTADVRLELAAEIAASPLDRRDRTLS